MRPKEIEAAENLIKKNSKMEQFFGMFLAPLILKDCCRFVLLLLYAVATGLAIFGAFQTKVYFTQMYFVSESSEVYDWFKANE